MEKVKKKNVKLTKLQFLRELAIWELSNGYVLADITAYLRLSVSDWFDMNEEQQKAYMNEFSRMSIENAMKGKGIRINQVPTWGGIRI